MIIGSRDNDLFGAQTVSARRIDVLPVSVIDIGSQLQIRREHGGHDSQSSRSGYSHFPDEVASLCFQLYLRDCRSIFDPFAGWGERGAHAKQYGKPYVGFDVSAEAISTALRVYGTSNLHRDSETADIPTFDGLITCPPYWNLERYSEAGIDACESYAEFLQRYQRILNRCYAAANEGAVFCFMVGDWRDNGIYYDLTHQTRVFMYHCGAQPVDEVVVSRSGITKIKVMIPQAVRLGYTVKTHESLVVFKKPVKEAA